MLGRIDGIDVDIARHRRADRGASGPIHRVSANTIHVGRKTATAEGRVHDPDGRLAAHGTTTCIIHR
jgi:acyl-coenzyme A thioesterase PaaI-like protein